MRVPLSTLRKERGSKGEAVFAKAPGTRHNASEKYIEVMEARPVSGLLLACFRKG